MSISDPVTGEAQVPARLDEIHGVFEHHANALMVLLSLMPDHRVSITRAAVLAAHERFGNVNVAIVSDDEYIVSATSVPVGARNGVVYVKDPAS